MTKIEKLKNDIRLLDNVRRGKLHALREAIRERDARAGKPDPFPEISCGGDSPLCPACKDAIRKSDKERRG